MTDTAERRFEKHVAIKAIDEDERTATGAVLVPWEVDRQRDFLRPEAVASMFNPAPEDGVMHAGFPEDAASTEHRMLEEPTTIGEEEFDAGTWIATREYHDDELWELVEDGVLTGFSIGGKVTSEVEYDAPEELPDEVEFADGVEPGEAREIQNGAVDEVSDVDIPAVPRALYATAKSVGKTIYDEATSREQFIEDMQERGHSEEDAGRLYDYLESVEKTAPDAVAKFFDRAETHTMSNDKTSDADDLDDEDVSFLKRLRQAVSPTHGADDGSAAAAKATDGGEALPEAASATLAKAAAVAGVQAVSKEGRTLSEHNRQVLMAAHDAVEAALASEMDFNTNRFTDDPTRDFDLSAFEEEKGSDWDDKALEKLTEEQGDLVVNAIQRFVDNQGEAPFADFESWVWSTDVLDDDTKFAADEATMQYRQFVREQRDEAPVTGDFLSWVEADSDADTDITMSDTNLEEKLEQLEDRIKEMENDDGNENGGDAGKSDTGDGGGDSDGGPDVEEKLSEFEERLDAISKGTADTDQLEGKSGNETDEKARDTREKVWTR